MIQKNFYLLTMFPYPSGNLHIGHWYNFAPADVFARFKNMNGLNVLEPIGFDAFGLPAENAAIKYKMHPKDWTYKNIKTMTAQLKSMGNMYDWSRQIITADPAYYKWTQWIFLQFYKQGLVYRKKAAGNWCPKCRTILANEQVVEGLCERCDTQVLQREIEQWLLKITDYAEKLLRGLDKLDWPERTKLMQKNWIGKSEGVIVKFQIAASKQFIEVFTTRLDTIFGCTYLVLSPEKAKELIKISGIRIQNFDEVNNYIKQSQKKTELERQESQEKTGVELKGIKAINPFNGEALSVFAGDYVLGSYGTGAVMAVPSHDERDFEFAKKYRLPIKEVILMYGGSTSYGGRTSQTLERPFTDDGVLVNSGNFTGLTSEQAREKMAKWLKEKKSGGKKINYKLRDWIISRQRYWGTPVPLVFCEHCAAKIKNQKSKIKIKDFSKFNFTKGELLNHGWIAVEEKDLPVKLPNVKNYLPTEEGRSPLAHSEKFVRVKCPKCGGAARRETDTMDTFVCSSWYYLRYVDPKNSKKFADSKKIKAWLPVNMYVGGAEHATMHLLYARFFTKVLHDLKYLDFEEPFSALRHQGVILGPDGQKMSKSRGNVIDPDELVKKFGSDCVRMYLCFMGPYDQGGPWNPTGILGIKRFLERVAKFSKGNFATLSADVNLDRLFHQTIKKVGEDIENFRFNTAISSLMILFNEMERAEQIEKEHLAIFLRLLAPFAPHLTDELWHKLGNKKSIHLEKWPKYNQRLIVEKNFDLIIQINGKFRGTISALIDITQKEAFNLVLQNEKAKKELTDSQGKIKEVKKIIFVHRKLINVVV